MLFSLEILMIFGPNRLNVREKTQIFGLCFYIDSSKSLYLSYFNISKKLVTDINILEFETLFVNNDIFFLPTVSVFAIGQTTGWLVGHAVQHVINS
ncbi:uncharacterized protein METZ01_LOCUS428562, partial [marine metagenome]